MYIMPNEIIVQQAIYELRHTQNTLLMNLVIVEQKCSKTLIYTIIIVLDVNFQLQKLLMPCLGIIS